MVVKYDASARMTILGELGYRPVEVANDEGAMLTHLALGRLELDLLAIHIRAMESR